MVIDLSDDDVRRLVVLLQNACAEVDNSARSDSVIQPDDPFALMASYDWGRGLLVKLGSPWVPQDNHRAAKAKCRLCNYQCVSVFPADADDEALECAQCGYMTLEAIEDIP